MRKQIDSSNFSTSVLAQTNPQPPHLTHRLKIVLILRNAETLIAAINQGIKTMA